MILLARISKWLKIRKSMQINFWHLGHQCLNSKKLSRHLPCHTPPVYAPNQWFWAYWMTVQSMSTTPPPSLRFFSALGLLESGPMHVHIYFHVHTNPHNPVSLIWPLFHTTASTYNLFRIFILIFDFTWCINHEKASNIHTEVQNTFVKKPEKWIKKRDGELNTELAAENSEHSSWWCVPAGYGLAVTTPILIWQA